MKTRTLGNSLEVSALGLGCMSMTSAYGPAADKAEHDQADSLGPRARHHLVRHR